MISTQFDRYEVKGGGGISLNYSAADSVLIEGTTISGNTAYSGGGGISHNSSSTTALLTIDNCTISTNESTTAGGGGISSATSGSATLTVNGSTISGNRAHTDGGGIHTDSLFSITFSTFSGNTAGYNNPGTGVGGAINFIDSDASGDEVVNCTFGENTAGLNGGGVRNAGTVDFINCTFSGNSALNGVGGNIYDDGGITNLQNTIVANSTSGGNCSGTIIDSGSNLCDDGTCGFVSGNNIDPMLDPRGLQDNGGSTQTITFLAGSPAIDGAADCAGLDSDQRGFDRPMPIGASCDVGALEVQSEDDIAEPLPIAAIPTLSEWGMIFMSLMMAAAAILMIRQRRVS